MTANRFLRWPFDCATRLAMPRLDTPSYPAEAICYVA